MRASHDDDDDDDDDDYDVGDDERKVRARTRSVIVCLFVYSRDRWCIASRVWSSDGWMTTDRTDG